jgi:chromatin segregation and condensation protein Rec8/ScpA/Scc1 (kleisin family)
MLTSAKLDIAVAPFIEGNELVIDLQVEDRDITPVRVPLAQLIDDYIQFNSELFGQTIAPANRDEAKELIGILRLAAHTLEQAIS